MLQLHKSFLSFVDTIQTRLQHVRKQAMGDSLGQSISGMMLPWVIDELESEQEFNRLVAETESAFSGDHHRKGTKLWHRAVHNYFWRSGYYLGLASGEFINLDDFFSKYCASFTEPKVQMTYLAPLEFVHFAQPSMDFGTFQIKRFSVQELETVLQHHINSIFYPWAAISSDSLKLLSQYWFIQITEPADPSQIGVFTLPASSSATLLFSGYAEREYTGFPLAVESALRQLCLFDWPSIGEGQRRTCNVMSRRDAEHAVWLKFNVPIVLKVNDDLIDFPERMPIIPELETEPLPDPKTQEELGRVPLVKVYLDKAETQHFVMFMKHIGDMTHSLEKDSDNWSFVEIALGYFTKAFLTPPNPDQLLWHIVIMEALLGEGPDGITERLARRIGLILGKDKNERKNISKRFRKLYDVRSSLIHGKSQSRADVTAIVDAYRFSRLAILWFLNYLSNIQSEIAKRKTGEKIPNRQEVLMLIDVDVDRRTHLRWLMDRVPSDFPYVATWIERP